MATDLSPFVRELTITPITVPTARNTAATVNPYFLKMFLTFSLSETLSSSSSLSFSIASICSNFAAIFSLVLSLTEGSSFSLFAISSSSRMDSCSSSIYFSFKTIKISRSGPRADFICLGRIGFNLCPPVALSFVNKG